MALHPETISSSRVCNIIIENIVYVAELIKAMKLQGSVLRREEREEKRKRREEREREEKRREKRRERREEKRREEKRREEDYCSSDSPENLSLEFTSDTKVFVSQQRNNGRAKNTELLPFQNLI
ncbi:hypothetical protein DUI87_20056 [Hirundo rustica rustica]|uniref:Uncharacterized protein n=1 Tax=Hirundo rustica rustica TaxID=333673 RepID=A0A3M0JUR0_HIRRU|nr:hypothetical protein DUI87_20056 [Hirundo rustica rustica]